MQPGQVTFFDQPERIFEPRFRLRRESGDDIGPKCHVRAQTACLLAKTDGVVAQVTALHSLEDQVIPMLQRQVQMWHQALLVRNGLHEVFIHLDGIDAANAQARQVRHQLQNPHHQIPQPRLPGQLGTPACEVNSGQHHLVITTPYEALDLINHDPGGHAARVSTTVGNDAECTAMIAPVLHLHICA